MLPVANKPFYFQMTRPYSQEYVTLPHQFKDTDGVGYNSAIQYIMAKKALLFGDEFTYSKIMAERDATQMIGLGRGIMNYNEKLWAANRFTIAIQANIYKFEQDDGFKSDLTEIRLGGHYFVCIGSTDLVWGNGLEMHHSLAAHPYRGKNLLGQVLTTVAEYLSI